MLLILLYHWRFFLYKVSSLTNNPIFVSLAQHSAKSMREDILVACECAGEWPSILVCRVLPFTPSCATPWSSPYAAVRRRKVIRTQNRSQRILNLHGLQYAMSFDLTMVGQWTDMSTNEKERKKDRVINGKYMHACLQKCVSLSITNAAMLLDLGRLIRSNQPESEDKSSSRSWGRSLWIFSVIFLFFCCKLERSCSKEKESSNG